MSEATWKTRDGTVVRVADMSDTHLVNAVRLVRRRFKVPSLHNRMRMWLNAMSYAEHAPDGAAMAAEEYAERLTDDDSLADMFPEFDDLLEEVDRRGLSA